MIDDLTRDELQSELKTFTKKLGEYREEHETTVSGEYKRCACNLCSAHRRLMDDKPQEEAFVELMTENQRLWLELERFGIEWDVGLCGGDHIRTQFNSAIGFSTKSPKEAAHLTAQAIRIALKDEGFKQLYTESKEAYRERYRERMKLADQTEALNGELEKMQEMISELETKLPGTDAKLHEAREKLNDIAMRIPSVGR